MENTEIQSEEIDPRYEEDPLEDNTADWGDSPVKDESLQVKDYDPEKYKSAVWVNVQNINVFAARVSGEDYVEKGIYRLIEIIMDTYKIDEIDFEPGNGNPFIAWEIEGRRQKSKVIYTEVDNEIEISIAIKNVGAAERNAKLNLI
jgi:hypothetical protein